MQFILTKRVWLTPLILFQGYLTFVMILYFIGPWPWGNQNLAKLLAFLVAAQIAIGLGYWVGWQKLCRIAAAQTNEDRAESIKKSRAFFDIAFWIYLVLLIPTALSRAGTAFPNVIEGINYTGAVYNDNYERNSLGNIFVLVEYFRMLLSPALIAFFPLLIIFWRDISKTKRAIGIAMIIYFTAIYISIGVNKGIADIILTLPWLIFIVHYAGSSGLRIPRWLFYSILLFIFALFMIFFGQGQEQRDGNVGLSGLFNSGLTIIRADSGWLGDIMNDQTRIIYESITRYLTSGYYALSLSFDIEHPSTYGIGNSMFFSRNIDFIFGTDYFTTQSIPGILEAKQGFPQFALWHSIYPWLASDVGFVGSLLVVGFFSYLLSLSWGLSIITLSHKWIAMFSIMIILFFYIPANNQIFQSGETAIGFILVGLWIFFDKRRGKSRTRRKNSATASLI